MCIFQVICSRFTAASSELKNQIRSFLEGLSSLEHLHLKMCKFSPYPQFPLFLGTIVSEFLGRKAPFFIGLWSALGARGHRHVIAKFFLNIYQSSKTFSFKNSAVNTEYSRSRQKFSYNNPYLLIIHT